MRRHHFPLAAVITSALLVVTACETDDEAEADDEPVVAQQQQQRSRDDDNPDDRDTNQRTRRQRHAEQCPMAVEGTTVDVERRQNDVAVEFTTTGDVEELRDRVTRMAQRHQKRAQEGRGMRHGGMMDDGGMQRQHMGDAGRGMMGDAGQMPRRGRMGDAGQMHRRGRMGDAGQMHRGGMMGDADAGQMRQRMMMMRSAEFATEEVEQGMRLTMTPENPDDLEQLHEQVQRHMARAEERGRCPMMEMMDQDDSDQ